MYQINRTIGFQKIAPRAPALVWLSADQQHAQTVSDAVNLNQRGIVAVCQFAVSFGQRESDHIAPSVGQGDGQFYVLPDRHAKRLGRVTINGNFKRR